VLGSLAAVVFLFAPAPELLALPEKPQLLAQYEGRPLRWLSFGRADVSIGGRKLASLSGPATLVADFQDEGFLRITMEPNTADNSVFWAPVTRQIFVNGRKLSCRVEGSERRLFYPILNNREPCEGYPQFLP
jgi:hypothetical protein